MDTIAAIATMGARGGVGIIRLSGPDSLSIGQKLFQSPQSMWEPRRLYYGSFHSSIDQRYLDSGLIVWMKGPKSFTGEDVVEIHCHGGDLNQRRILEATLAAGARIAEPGEFTRRAFLNDKMDLSQAEALMDVLQADTESALDAAHAQMRGTLHNEVERVRKEMLQIISHLEVNIDFLQEDVPLFDPEVLASRMDDVQSEVEQLLKTFRQGKVLREGLKIALVGPPNAGKSSLFNALLREQRAIVTPVAGTTRDYLEEKLDLPQLPLVLVDTAGVRETSDPIEREGVFRSQQQIEEADLLLLLLDGSSPPPVELEEWMNPERRDRQLIVRTKSDLATHETWVTPFPFDLELSSETGEGVSDLLQSIRKRFALNEESVTEKALVTKTRHAGALKRTHIALSEAATALRSAMPFEIVAGEMQLALEAIGEIVGVTTPDDILNHIFSEFCIGK